MSRGAARIAALIAALACLAVVAIASFRGDGLPDEVVRQPSPPGSIPIAVLGDSNSHSYQDGVSFPPGSTERGGALRPRTLQWVEVLARLRGSELDPGPWVTWGRSGNLAWARELIGLPAGRAPRKQDYLYNFANSGAACKNLMGDRMGQRFRQAPRLVQLMDRNPERWRHGLVVIRIGHNDWAGLLDLQARDPAAPELAQVKAYCTGQIEAAIALIQAHHPGTRVLVVGVVNEADDPAQFDRYRSPAETSNLKAALAGFNDALRLVAAGDPQRRAFFDDAAWFERLWGARDARGEPAYRTVDIGSVLHVTNTAGDAPTNALLEDHHAGLAWNALWAQALVARLRDSFGLPLTPIGDEELARFVAAIQSGQVRAPGS